MAAAAASTQMDTIQYAHPFLVGGKEGGKEVSDIIKGERVDGIGGVGLEVAVVFVHQGRDQAEVEVILGEVVGLTNIFPVGEVEVLLTMEQVSLMNVAIIALVMAG